MLAIIISSHCIPYITIMHDFTSRSECNVMWMKYNYILNNILYLFSWGTDGCRHNLTTLLSQLMLTVTKYSFLKWQWFFSVLRRFFFFPLLKTRLIFDYKLWVTRRMSYKKYELLTFHQRMCSPPFFFIGVRVALFLVFCLFVFILYLVFDFTCFSDLSILDYPFGFL